MEAELTRIGTQLNQFIAHASDMKNSLFAFYKEQEIFNISIRPWVGKIGVLTPDLQLLGQTEIENEPSDDPHIEVETQKEIEQDVKRK